MALAQQIFESFRGRESTAPRSILGFLLAMFGFVLTGAVAVTLGLIDSDSDGLIVYLLCFIAVLAVSLIAVVLVIAWKDPSKLMLGQITGREYLAIRQVTLGDSTTGETVSRILGPPAPTGIEAAAEPKGELPSGEEAE